MGVGWIKEEERETKRKLSVRKESWKLTAETEHLMADQGRAYPPAPQQHQPSRAELEGKGSMSLPRHAREGKRRGGVGIGRRWERSSKKPRLDQRCIMLKKKS